MVCCTGSLAGSQNNAQVITTHTGLPVSVFGCKFSDAQMNVSANDNEAGSLTYAFFCDFEKGAREGGVEKTVMYGCYQDRGTGPGDNKEDMTWCYIKASPGGASTTSVARAYSGTLESCYLESDTGTGRAIFNRELGAGKAEGCIFDNWGEAILLDFLSGGPYLTPLESTNNTFINNTEAIQQNTGLPLSLTNSAAKDNSSSIVTSAGGFAEITGSSNTLDANVDSDYTGLADDILAVDAALDSALRPTASGNCDENGIVPSSQVLGKFDPFGLERTLDKDTIPRGARARLVSTGDLYPLAV